MTPKENFLAFFSDKSYEWRPIRDDILKFAPEEFPDNAVKKLVAQQRPFHGNGGGKGWFGVEWLFEESAGGAIDKGRIIDSVADWRSVPFTPLDSYDWKSIAGQNSEYLKTDRLIQMTIYSGYMERLISLMDFEDTLLTLIDEDLAEPLWEFFSALTDYYIDFIRRSREYFGLEFIEIHDDWGAQNAPLISAETHRRVLQPHIKRVIQACHDMGIIYLQHSCGNIQDIFDCVVESGADTWIGQYGVNDRPAMIKKFPSFHFGAPIRPSKSDSLDKILEDAELQMRQFDGLRAWFYIDLRQIDPRYRKQVQSFIRKFVGRPPQLS